MVFGAPSEWGDLEERRRLCSGKATVWKSVRMPGASTGTPSIDRDPQQVIHLGFEELRLVHQQAADGGLALASTWARSRWKAT